MNDDLDRELRTHLELEAEAQREAGLFAVIALVLAAVGLYGVTAYSIDQAHASSASASRWGRNAGNC